MFWFSVLLPQTVREGVPSTECAIEGVCAVFTHTHLQRASYSMFHEDVLAGMNAVGSLRIGSQDTVGELLGVAHFVCKQVGMDERLFFRSGCRGLVFYWLLKNHFERLNGRAVLLMFSFLLLNF